MSEPVLSVKQAAEAAGVSRATVYRKLDELMEHGATRDETGTWIPFSALITVGLAPRTSPAGSSSETRPATRETRPETRPETRETDSETELRERLREAEDRIRDLQHAKALAEAIAVERERVIEVQSRALRLLEAGPSVRHGETVPVSRETRNEASGEAREKPLQGNESGENETRPETRETSSEARNETRPETRVRHGETVPETGVESPVTASESASAESPLESPDRPSIWRRLWPF